MKIRKTIAGSFLVLGCLYAFTACSNSDDDNCSLDYTQLQINLSGKTSGAAIPQGSVAGVFAECTRDGKERHQLAANKAYTADAAGNLLPSAEERIISERDDHNYGFYAYYPYDGAIADPTRLSVSVPRVQTYVAGQSTPGMFVASTLTTNIIPTVEMEFHNIFTTLEFDIAYDIFTEDGGTIVRSISVEPADAAAFDGYLAYDGFYDLLSGNNSPDAATLSKSITLDMGADGLALTGASTSVSIAAAPFTVPAGGLKVTVTDINGESSVAECFNNEDMAGKYFAAGETNSAYISGNSDGTIPVTFPVKWPVGKDNGNPTNNPTLQPRWVPEGIWTSTQSQAYAFLHKETEPLEGVFQTREFVNSGAISSTGVKGLWTGDYFEFVLPVKKFKANTTVMMAFPLYGRQHPVFWDIEYLDGDEWKCNRSVKTAYDPDFSMECTFSARRGTTIVRHAMVFTQPVNSGELRIRLKVADGSVQANTDTKCEKRTSPWLSGGIYGAPFYFHDATAEITEISVDLN